MLEEEDILVHEGGFVLDVIRAVRDPTTVLQKLDVATKKLLHKTRASIMKGEEYIKELANKAPDGINPIRWYNNTYNYVASRLQDFENKHPIASMVTSAASGFVGALGVIYVKNRIKRALQQSDTAVLTAPPTRQSVEAAIHAATGGLLFQPVRSLLAGPSKKQMATQSFINRERKKPFPHGEPKGIPKIGELKRFRNVNWKTLPLTALAAISGAAAMRYFRRIQQPHLPPFQNPNHQERYANWLNRMHWYQPVYKENLKTKYNLPPETKTLIFKYFTFLGKPMRYYIFFKKTFYVFKLIP